MTTIVVIIIIDITININIVSCNISLNFTYFCSILFCSLLLSSVLFCSVFPVLFFRFSSAGTIGNTASKGQKYSSSLNGTASLANHLNGGKRHGSMMMDQVTPYIVEAIKGTYMYYAVVWCGLVCCNVM